MTMCTRVRGSEDTVIARQYTSLLPNVDQEHPSWPGRSIGEVVDGTPDDEVCETCVWIARMIRYSKDIGNEHWVNDYARLAIRHVDLDTAHN